MSIDTISANPLLRIARRKATAATYLARKEFYRVCRKTDFTWRYIANLSAWLEYQRVRKPLNAVQQRLLSDLALDGIALTSVDEFLSDPSLFEELERGVETREAALADEITTARTSTDIEGEIKSYLISLFERRHVFDPDDIFIRFAVQPEIASLANSYFGMLTKLFYCNVWHNLPMRGEPRESQLWHRDPEDRYILKLFVYLTDVDEQSGPLSYAPGTHAKGSIKTAPEATLCKEGAAYNYRTDDKQMARVVGRENWITAVGPKRTMLFVDTSGFHKGGLVRQNDRVLYNCMFNSLATSYPRSLRPKLSRVPNLGRAEAFLLQD